MAGHSKWANIKHRKAKGDAAKANVFTKIGRELSVAVKQGGPDPSSNSRLKDAIAKARENNMPNDNILRSIKKASGEAGGVNYEQITYEGYGPFGVAVFIECLTDNKNRTAGEMRHILDKSGGSLGTTGSVGFMFRRRGVIVVDKEGCVEEDLMLLALDAGADDFQDDGEIYLIYTPVSEFTKTREAIENIGGGVKILSAAIDMIPDNTVKLDLEGSAKIRKMLDKLDDDDDVQNVFHNAELEE